MWQRVQQAFSDALERAAVGAARILPGLVVLAVVLGASFAVASAMRAALRRACRAIGLDRRAHGWGLGDAQEVLPARSITAVVAGVGFWAVILAGFLIGLQVFDTTTELAMRALAYLPQVLVALLLFGVAFPASRFLERAVLISAVNMQLRSARLLSMGVKWLVLVFGASMAMEHLGIGGMLVTISFSILFGGIVLGVALAVGLGSREEVRRAWDERHDRREATDELHHL